PEVRAACGQHSAPVRDVAFSADGGDLACLASQGVGVPIQELTIWPMTDPLPRSPTRRACWRGGFADEAHRLTAHPGRPALLFPCQKTLRAWALASGRFSELGPFPHHGGIACDPDGMFWAACHHDVRRGAAPDRPPALSWSNLPPDQLAGHTFYSVAAGRRWALAGRRD